PAWRRPTPAARTALRRAAACAAAQPRRRPQERAPGNRRGATPARAARVLPRTETPAPRAGETAPPAARRSIPGVRTRLEPGVAAGIARGGILGETAVDHLRQAVGYARDERRDGRRRIGDVAREHRHGVGAVER